MYNILVVDDEGTSQKSIESIMEEETIYEFTSAKDTQEALDLLKRQSFDLIMWDISIAEKDILETLRFIREKYQTSVVLITEDKSLGFFTEIEKMGCEDCVTKPFFPVLLKEVIYNTTKN